MPSRSTLRRVKSIRRLPRTQEARRFVGFRARKLHALHTYRSRHKTAGAIDARPETEKFRRAVCKAQRPGAAEIAGRNGISRRAGAGILRLRSKARYPQSAKWLTVAQERCAVARLRALLECCRPQSCARMTTRMRSLNCSEFRKEYPGLGNHRAGAANRSATPRWPPTSPQEMSLPPSKLSANWRKSPRCCFCVREARERSGATGLTSSQTINRLYLRFPLSERAREAGESDYISSRQFAGDKLAADARRTADDHANTIFDGARSGAMRAMNTRALLPHLSGGPLERARIAHSRMRRRRSAEASREIARHANQPIPTWTPSAIDALAEILSRPAELESQMIAAVEAAVSRAPASRWAESALFLAGNYYWVQLDRDRAASYYKRLADRFPVCRRTRVRRNGASPGPRC